MTFHGGPRAGTRPVPPSVCLRPFSLYGYFPYRHFPTTPGSSTSCRAPTETAQEGHRFSISEGMGLSSKKGDY